MRNEVPGRSNKEYTFRTSVLSWLPSLSFSVSYRRREPREIIPEQLLIPGRLQIFKVSCFAHAENRPETVSHQTQRFCTTVYEALYALSLKPDD